MSNPESPPLTDWTPPEVLLTLPPGSEITALERRDGTVYAVTTCGTFKLVRGKMVLCSAPSNQMRPLTAWLRKPTA